MNRDRRPLVAGNWKMHHGGPTGVELAGAVVRFAQSVPHVDLVVAPPYTALAARAPRRMKLARSMPCTSTALGSGPSVCELVIS